MQQAFIVTGLGYGDEGKGTTTDWLTHEHRAHTVIRTGGPQALHHVVHSDGRSHVFSQFGSGTLRGAATHLSKYMMIDPFAILQEGDVLENKHGVSGVFDRMTIHGDALVITPFQAIAGRTRELLRGKARRGSVGIGVGETVLDSQLANSDLTIRARDLVSGNLGEKLRIIQAHKWNLFAQYADRASDLPPDVGAAVRAELADMNQPETVSWALKWFGELTKRVSIVDTDYVAENILQPTGTVVFEGSQGVLLDPEYGFYPYITRVRTTPQHAHAIMRECNYNGVVESFGILRAYHTRHGGGPFVCESSELTKALPDEVNQVHKWQGNFRVGSFDMVAARYALQATSVDSLVVTCLDRIYEQGAWVVCDAYDVPRSPHTDPLFMFDDGVVSNIKTPDAECVNIPMRQMQIAETLAGAKPQLQRHDLGDQTRDVFERSVIDRLETGLQTPVRVVSWGQTALDKMYI